MLTGIPWTVLEDIGSLLPSSQTRKLAEQLPPVTAQTANSHRTTGSKQRVMGRRTNADLPRVPAGGTRPAELEASKALYSVDAFHLGNVRAPASSPRGNAHRVLTRLCSVLQWTRFCNHVCTDFNVLIRPVYIDEADVSRPLFVYFARRDIHVRSRHVLFVPSLPLVPRHGADFSPRLLRPSCSPGRRSPSPTLAARRKCRRARSGTRPRNGSALPTKLATRHQSRTAVTVGPARTQALGIVRMLTLLYGSSRRQKVLPRSHV